MYHDGCRDYRKFMGALHRTVARIEFENSPEGRELMWVTFEQLLGLARTVFGRPRGKE